MKKNQQAPKTPPATPAMASRAIAFDVLQNVLRKRQPFDESLEHHPALGQLAKRDRGFVHALVAVTLRRLGQIDDVVKSCLDKPETLKAAAQDLLRLGAAQLLFLGTPAHAAVDTIVELAGSDNATAPYKGLINAVLRRLTREGAALIAKQDAEKLNTPAWLWLSWRQTYGVGKAREIAAANQAEALTDISVKADAADWAARLQAKLLPTGSLRLQEGRETPTDVEEASGLQSAPPPDLPREGGGIRSGITALAGFAEGAWWVQDAAASLPVLLLGNVRGQRVIDLCAAPGGKTAQLAARGAEVVAVDRSDKRLGRLRDNLARLRLEAEIIVSDALKYLPDAKAPFVLLDAPCSATGTIRRHPDVPHLKTQEDVMRMAALQAALLNHAVRNLLVSGGVLVYAVCSLQPEETRAQIEAMLKSWPQLRRRPVKPEEIGGEAGFITTEGDIRCLPCQWPDHGGIDGFYAARLVLS